MNIKINIEKLDDYGRGIGYYNNKIIFVYNAIVGEEVVLDIIKETSKYYEGKVVNYLKKSDKRIESICPYYDKCGGCNLLHMTYEDGSIFKIEKVKNILNKFANINSDIEYINNDNIYNYRNKVELKIKDNLWGYYNSNTHDFVSIDNCLLGSNPVNNVIKNKELFDINNGRITIRSNYNNEVIISIYSSDKVSVDIDKLKSIVKLVGIVINDKKYYGDSYFIELVKDKYFKVNYNSFFQVNLSVINKLIDVINKLDLGDNLLDLYCGVGFLGQVLSDKFNKIYGIEKNENSVLDAIYNAKLNNIKNTYYLCGDSSKLISKIKDNIDTIIVDPPRTGLVKNMIEDILKIEAKNIIYVSCDPISLARDLNILKDKYNIEKFYLFDMFSNTYHIESMVLLKKI